MLRNCMASKQEYDSIVNSGRGFRSGNWGFMVLNAELELNQGFSEEGFRSNDECDFRKTFRKQDKIRHFRIDGRQERKAPGTGQDNSGNVAVFGNSSS